MIIDTKKYLVKEVIPDIYQHKPTKVAAKQLPDFIENREALVEVFDILVWAQAGELSYNWRGVPEISFPNRYGGRSKVARPGDYVVLYEGGFCELFNKEYFETLYQPLA